MSQELAIKAIRNDMNRLRGHLFGAIEVTGMPETQQDPLKKLVRKLTYDAQTNVERAIRESIDV